MEICRTIAEILGKPAPRFALPAWLFRLYGRAEYWGSNLIGRRPAMTPNIADTLCYTVLVDSRRAIEELGYEPSSVREMLLDCHDWMVRTGRLLPARNN